MLEYNKIEPKANAKKHLNKLKVINKLQNFILLFYLSKFFINVLDTLRKVR